MTWNRCNPFMFAAATVKWKEQARIARAFVCLLVAMILSCSAARVAGMDRIAVVAPTTSSDEFAPGLTELKWKADAFEQSSQGWARLGAKLHDYDIVLARGGVDSPAAELPQKLLSFMESGGALVVTGIDSADALAWLTALDEKYAVPVVTPEKPQKAPTAAVNPDPNNTLLSYPSPTTAAEVITSHFTLSGPAGREWRIAGRRGSDNQPCVIVKTFGKGALILSTARYRDAAFLSNVAKLLELQRMNVGFVKVTHKFGGSSAFSFGRGSTQLTLENTSENELVVHATLRVVGEEATRTFRGTARSQRRGQFSVDIPVAMDLRGRSEVTLVLSDAQGSVQSQILSFDAFGPRFLEIDPPTYRGMISTARRDPTVRFDIYVNPDLGEDVEGLTLRASASGPDGTVVSEKDILVSEPGRIPVALPLPMKTAPGTYTLHAKVVSGRPTDEAASASFKIVPVRPGQMFVDQDGILLKEGKPFFPLGLYHVAGDEIEAAARTGINMIQLWNWDATPANFEKLKKAGLTMIYEDQAWAQIVHNAGKNPKHFDFEINPQFRANAERVRDDPSRVLGMWYTADEPSYSMIPYINRLRDYWHNLDEDHPTYIVSTGDPRIHEGADVLGVDIYPIYYGTRRPLRIVGDSMDTARQGVRYRKPVIAVVQAFGNNERHRETPEEVRAMSYIALTHGVQGIIWYCWKETGDRTGAEGAGYHPETVAVLTEVIAEAKVFAPALLEPNRSTLKSRDGHVHAILARSETTGRFLVYVNTEYEPTEAALVLPELAGATLEPLFNGPSGSIVDGTLTLKLPALATGAFRVIQK